MSEHSERFTTFDFHLDPVLKILCKYIFAFFLIILERYSKFRAIYRRENLLHFFARRFVENFIFAEQFKLSSLKPCNEFKPKSHGSN